MVECYNVIRGLYFKPSFLRKEIVMKKLICLCLTSLALISCLTACSDGGKTVVNEGDDVKVISFDTTRQEETTKKIRKNKTYKVPISQDLIVAEFDGDVASYAATYGYEIVSNENGAITFKMDGEQYQLLLSRVGAITIGEIGQIVDSESFPFVVDFADYAKDFSYILVLVDGKKYNKEKNKEMFPTLLSQCGLYYQSYYAPEAPSCKVVLADSESGKVLFNETYTQ